MTTSKRHPICILCIDDDPVMHALLKSQFTASSNFISLHSQSSKEAFDLLRTNRVDVILLDINMPGLDGFQTLHHLQAEENSSRIPVIFLSSLDQDHLKVKALSQGADDYIVKPFKGPELIARIHALLRRTAPTPDKKNAISGKIKDLDVLDLLNMLSFTGKNGLVTFPEMDGEIIVASGMLNMARQGDFIGQEALLRLCLLDRGTFTVDTGHSSEAIYPRAEGIEFLVLHIATKKDEIKEKIDILLSSGSHLQLDQPNGNFPDLENLLQSVAIEPLDLVLVMAEDVNSNLDTISQAIKQQVIKPVSL